MAVQEEMVEGEQMDLREVGCLLVDLEKVEEEATDQLEGMVHGLRLFLHRTVI